MRRKKRLGSLPARHTHEGRVALVRTTTLARSVVANAEAGRCATAYEDLLRLYEAAGEVKVHRASGGQLELNDRVEHAEHRFADSCAVISRDKYYQLLAKK